MIKKLKCTATFDKHWQSMSDDDDEETTKTYILIKVQFDIFGCS